MKKSILRPAVVTAAALALLLCAAAGVDDPLISLGYLRGAYLETVDKRVEEALDRAAPGQSGTAPESSPYSTAAAWQEASLKEGDVLRAVTGTGVLLLSGAAEVRYEAGAVVDLTTGEVTPSGAALLPRHRYLTAEDTAARFIVTGPSAVLDYQGPYAFSYSQTVDYAAMAAGLKQLGLFRGTFTGYGRGFDLEAAPTRLQALIMFIRLLGEEEQALAWAGATPFRDIQNGSQAERYVGYAYEKGYTNGYTEDTFRPGDGVSVRQYTEFILRAMGYSTAANTDLSAVLSRAASHGVLTEGEAAALDRQAFLRAQLVYVSFRSLEAPLPQGGQTLAERLMGLGLFSRETWETVRGQVPAWRL